MKLSPALVGTKVGPIAQEVDARWLMAYAAGLGETDRRYYDTTAESGPAAHPLFPVCYEWHVALALRARVLADGVSTRSVHATHEAWIHRPPRAGDRLVTTAVITAIEPRPAGTLMVVRFETADANGEPVSTSDYGSVYRGVQVDGPAVLPSPRAPAPDVALAPVGPLAVSPQLAHVYTECAHIWNPIHTDLAVARAMDLSEIILHGTATLALAVSRLVAERCAGDPTRVRRIGCRFTGMVPLPSVLTLRASDPQVGGSDVKDPALPSGPPRNVAPAQTETRREVIHFDVVNQAGNAVVRAGAIHL